MTRSSAMTRKIARRTRMSWKEAEVTLFLSLFVMAWFMVVFARATQVGWWIVAMRQMQRIYGSTVVAWLLAGFSSLIRSHKNLFLQLELNVRKLQDGQYVVPQSFVTHGSTVRTATD